MKEKIEDITNDPIDTKKELEVFNDLYLHGYLNKDSPPMNSKKLLSMGKTLGLQDFEVLDSEDYLNKVKQGIEPENCIIFIENKHSRIGHFTAAYTDDEYNINYSDSLGSSNSKRFIDKLKNSCKQGNSVNEFPKRKVIVHNNTSYQSDNTSNCGYLSLLFLVSHSHAAVRQEE